MGKRKPHVEDTVFQAGQLPGQSKEARNNRAHLIATLAAQSNLYLISGTRKANTEGNDTFVYAVIFGDEEQDGQRAWNWCDLLNDVPKLVAENERLRKCLADLEALMKNGGTITVNLQDEESGAGGSEGDR